MLEIATTFILHAVPFIIICFMLLVTYFSFRINGESPIFSSVMAGIAIAVAGYLVAFIYYKEMEFHDGFGSILLGWIMLGPWVYDVFFVVGGVLIAVCAVAKVVEVASKRAASKRKLG